MKQHTFTLLMTVLAVAVSLVAVPLAQASNYYWSSCGTYYSYPIRQEKVVYRDVIQPVAYPVPFTVAVPVISYLHNGVTYSPVYTAQLASPAPAVVTQQQQQTATQTSTTATGLSDAQMAALMNRFDELMKAKYGISPTSTAGNNPPPPVPSSDDLTAKVKSILSKNCASCHTGAASKGQVVIFSDKEVLNPNAPRQRIWDAADEGRMPPEAKKDAKYALSDADVAQLRAWMLSK